MHRPGRTRRTARRTPLNFKASALALRSQPRPQHAACTECGRPLRPARAGTQRVEQEVRRLFPATRVLRLDRDTARSAEHYESILGRFTRHEADVLVGTQMVAKGLDLPLVTLVGVVLAAAVLLILRGFIGANPAQLATLLRALAIGLAVAIGVVLLVGVVGVLVGTALFVVVLVFVSQLVVIQLMVSNS